MGLTLKGSEAESKMQGNIVSKSTNSKDISSFHLHDFKKS